MLIDTTTTWDYNVSGIYAIKSTNCDKWYIGSAVDLRKRCRDHSNELKKGIHKNNRLQNFYNKYGDGCLIFEILMYCPKDILIRMEQWYIDRRNNYFNISKTAGSTLGVACAEETKEKIRKANTGRKLSPEMVTKCTAHFKGIKLSLEHRKKIGKSQKNNVEAMQKKREARLGEKCPFVKLKEVEVIYIKEQLRMGKKGRDLAKEFNLNENTISNIKTGKIWKHVL